MSDLPDAFKLDEHGNIVMIGGGFSLPPEAQCYTGAVVCDVERMNMIYKLGWMAGQLGACKEMTQAAKELERLALAREDLAADINPSDLDREAFERGQDRALCSEPGCGAMAADGEILLCDACRSYAERW